MSLGELPDDNDDDDDFDPSAPDDADYMGPSVHVPPVAPTNTSAARFGVPYDMYDDEDEDGEAGGPSDEIRFSHERYFSERLLLLLRGSLSGGDPASHTGLLSGVYPMLLHQSDSPHPERPARMVAIYHEIIEQGLDARCKLVPVRVASSGDLSLVHTAEQVVASTASYASDEAATAKLGLDGDTYFAARASGYAAMLSAGSVVELTTRVCHGELRNALAVVRPPGHHCEQNQAMGFCLLNNVCVAVAAARRRLGVGRVLIFDWDVHHGNGVQHIFDEDPNVLYVSTHRFGRGFYPGTGHPSEVGVGAGEGTSVNVAFRGTGYGDREFMHAFDRCIMPIAREYGPELVVVSAGFDAAAGDPLGGMALSPAGYAHMTAQLQTLAHGKLVIALEGGYNLRSISTSAAAALRVLLGDPPEPIARGAPRADAMADVEATVEALRPFWKVLQPPAPKRGLDDDGERHLRRKLKLRHLRRKLKAARRHRGPWWFKFL